MKNVDVTDPLYQELCKCDSLATKYAAVFPENPEFWQGTVSERLEAILSHFSERVSEQEAQLDLLSKTGRV